MKNRLSASLSLLALCASFSAVSGTITGTVKDTDGNPVIGATVRVEGSATTAKTDENGNYTLTNAPQDHAHLHVVSANHLHGDVALNNIGDTHTQDFVLQTAIMDNIQVTANALQRSQLEMTSPVSILTGEDLEKAEAPSLGEMLQDVPGVHNTYFGPVAGSPIIRGVEGPRVKLIQNGLDASDASRVGADHNIAIDGSNATQIEVLHGPATLQYGNGAIGGVVNVVDNRIPKYVPDSPEGEVEVRYESVNEEEFAKVDFTAGEGNWAFHFDAFDRDTENYDIPGFAEAEPHEGEEPGTLPNSSVDTTSYTAGLSYVGDKGYIGFSFQDLDNNYGVPGHGHHEEEGHDGHDDDHDAEEGEEEEVFLDVDMQRYQIDGEWYDPMAGISKIKYTAGYTDYEHTEFENGSVGTTFSNETHEQRLTFEHTEVAGWHGVVGLHYSNTDYAAVGDEAFTPPSETDSFALFVIEEKQFGDFTVNLGARFDRSDVDPVDSITVESAHFIRPDDDDDHHDEEDDHHDEEDEHHDDDDDHHDDDEHDEDGHEDESATFNLFEQSFDSLSLSAGVNWQYQAGRSVAVNLSRSERAPSHQELFSAGNHIATRTFELGALFDIDEDGELIAATNAVQEETSTNLDLTFRKVDGDWGYSVSLFYNQVDDYLYQANTGFFAEAGHDEHGEEGDDHHDEEEEHHDDEEEEHHDDDDEHHDDDGDEHGHEEEELGNPVFAFQQRDATFYGIEAEFHTELNEHFGLTLYGDLIRARLDNPVNGTRNLPRIPPMRLGFDVDFDYNNWYGDIGLNWYDDQDDIGQFETQTDGYTMVDFSVNYRKEFKGLDWVFYLRGRNLFDEEARVHSSFIKDLAPLPGRNFAVGVRAEF